MSYLFDYGEALICFIPIFLMISFVAAALLWNSLPPRSEKDKK